MNLHDLLVALHEDESIHYLDDRALLMATTEDGMMHSVKSVEYEVHEDADGSATIWFRTEGY